MHKTSRLQLFSVSFVAIFLAAYVTAAIAEEGQCPPVPTVPSCSEGTYPISIISDGCIVGYECKASEPAPSTTSGSSGSSGTTQTTPAGCPPLPTVPTCSAGFVPYPKNENGCIVSYECGLNPDPSVQIAIANKISPTSCPAKVFEIPTCGPDQHLFPIYENGCLVGQKCVAGANQEFCTAEYKPVCGADGKTYPNSCFARLGGTSVAHEGQCVQKVINETRCREVTNEAGLRSIVCEGVKSICPTPDPRAKERCVAAGGTPIPTSYGSCDGFYQCRFEKDIKTNPISWDKECTAREEIEHKLQSCSASGLKGYVAMENGCPIVKCSQHIENTCRPISTEDREKIENECRLNGGKILKSFDSNGCGFLSCARPGAGEVLKESSGGCTGSGGEHIVKKDELGNIVFSECVRKGDPSKVYVEGVKEVPSVDKLLSTAIKLESLRVEIIKLRNEATEIARYYRSTNTGDAERYERVVDMFNSAIDDVDEIKNDIRENLGDLTAEDMIDIRHKIKYLKEVTLKDIVYVMLSSSEDVKEIEQERKKDCKNNLDCFNEAFRLCKPSTFDSTEINVPRIEITGLSGDRCVMKVEMSKEFIPPITVDNIKPPYTMTCRIPDYPKGIRDKEDVLPNCEGSLATLMEHGLFEGGNKQ